MAPGWCTRSRASSASRTTAVCSATLPGGPKTWPRRKRTKTLRGAGSPSVILLATLTATVAIPLASTARATNPTDW